MHDGSAHSIAHVALLIAIVLAAAKAGGEAAMRIKQPPVLGELVAGIVLGNLPVPVFRELGTNPAIDMLSGLGVILLLFGVGLESTVRGVLEVGGSATRVAVLGVVGAFTAGWLASGWFLPDASTLVRAFLAASVTATSVGISARVFKDLGQTRSLEARTILGAAVVDDVLALLILALVTGWVQNGASGAPPSALSLGWVLLKTIAFLTAAILVGRWGAPRLFSIAARLRAGGAQIAVGLAFCFSLAWAAEAIGLAAIVGAFAAGLVLEEAHSARFVERGERPLAQLVEPVSEFLVPIFFVVMGVRANVSAFFEPKTLTFAVLLTLAAIAGKVTSGLGAARGVSRLTVGFGMMPLGEVALIFANLGTTLTISGQPLLDRKAYSSLVAVVLFTTLLAPVALKWSFDRKEAA
jgi:Kef-type K+ transport system membrane component KefB